jgi:hypothetical protein
MRDRDAALDSAIHEVAAILGEDYAGEAPIIHQAVAVKAATDALDAAFQETGDPN